MKKKTTGSGILDSILENSVPETVVSQDASGDGVEPPFEPLESSSAALQSAESPREELLRSLNLKVRVELGRRRMLVKEAVRLVPGTVVDLEKLADEPVDLFVGDVLIGRGEVIVVDDSFCVRVTEVLPPVSELQS